VSDTPRTDEVSAGLTEDDKFHNGHEWKHWYRALERELNQANAQIAALRGGTLAYAIAQSLYGYFRGGSAGSSDAVVYFIHNSKSGECKHLIERVQRVLDGVLSSPAPDVVPLEDAEALFQEVERLHKDIGFSQSDHLKAQFKRVLDTFRAKHPKKEGN
jgi:hypothetical protein